LQSVSVAQKFNKEFDQLIIMYEYLIWLLIFVILPFIILWIWKFRDLIKYKKVFFLATIGSLIFSIPWDVISVRENIWYFRKPHILGIWLFGLPIEEYLFIIFVTLLFSSITILLWEKLGVKI
jgi:lycopene cyclase domain-containing protein